MGQQVGGVCAFGNARFLVSDLFQPSLLVMDSTGVLTERLSPSRTGGIMSPIDWAMLPLSKYADFSGRAPRAEYWWFYLLYVVIYTVASIIGSLIGLTTILRGLVVLALFVPLLAAGVRRLHDGDRSGWWMLGPLIPLTIGLVLAGPAVMAGGMGAALGVAGLFMVAGAIVGVVIFVFLVLPGTTGANRFGGDPYGADAGGDVLTPA